jgi:hypothetical protein
LGQALTEQVSLLRANVETTKSSFYTLADDYTKTKIEDDRGSVDLDAARALRDELTVATNTLHAANSIMQQRFGIFIIYLFLIYFFSRYIAVKLRFPHHACLNLPVTITIPPDACYQGS